MYNLVLVSAETVANLGGYSQLPSLQSQGIQDSMYWYKNVLNVIVLY